MSHDRDHFYAELESFEAFEEFADFDAYRPVPEDWVVMAGDVRGSTRAIEAGHYKAVNMVGAAVITAVLNACGENEVPYVFGGDGGAVVVPGRLASPASAALRGLQAHAQAAFGLDLRAAAVPVSRLRADGYDVRVRRMRLNGANHLAMFAGGGIDRTDAILKSGEDDRDVLVPGDDVPAPDLGGLSCRWEPLAARHGRMIALMVQPADPASAGTVYRETLDALAAALGDGIRAHAPASDATLRFRWPPRGIGLEARAVGIGAGRFGPWVRGLATSLVQLWCHWRGVEIGGYHGVHYKEELKAQTDFRKFDGCLRTVLDCTPDQVAAIEGWLEDQYRAGRLVYGLHADETALMTCLVFNLYESAHVHFVDAGGGGFAMAATGFKARLQALGTAA